LSRQEFNAAVLISVDKVTFETVTSKNISLVAGKDMGFAIEAEKPSHPLNGRERCLPLGLNGVVEVLVILAARGFVGASAVRGVRSLRSL